MKRFGDLRDSRHSVSQALSAVCMVSSRVLDQGTNLAPRGNVPALTRDSGPRASRLKKPTKRGSKYHETNRTLNPLNSKSRSLKRLHQQPSNPKTRISNPTTKPAFLTLQPSNPKNPKNNPKTLKLQISQNPRNPQNPQNTPKPTKPTKPTKPAKPTKPTKPTKPENPNPVNHKTLNPQKP